MGLKAYEGKGRQADIPNPQSSRLLGPGRLGFPCSPRFPVLSVEFYPAAPCPDGACVARGSQSEGTLTAEGPGGRGMQGQAPRWAATTYSPMGNTEPSGGSPGGSPKI